MPYFCNPLPKLLQISVIIKKISIDFSYLTYFKHIIYKKRDFTKKF